MTLTSQLRTGGIAGGARCALSGPRELLPAGVGPEQRRHQKFRPRVEGYPEGQPPMRRPRRQRRTAGRKKRPAGADRSSERTSDRSSDKIASVAAALATAGRPSPPHSSVTSSGPHSSTNNRLGDTAADPWACVTYAVLAFVTVASVATIVAAVVSPETVRKIFAFLLNIDSGLFPWTVAVGAS
nr:uncharacterized protein LOC129382049 [Dermacentor andersoni]